jgi:hypothetical protein
VDGVSLVMSDPATTTPGAATSSDLELARVEAAGAELGVGGT